MTFYVSEDHVWYDPKSGKVGLTRLVMEQLGDVVEINICPIQTKLHKDDVFSTLESLKTVHEILAPLSLTVKRINPALQDLKGWQNLTPPDNWLFQGDANQPTDHLKPEEDLL
jgi:glycine cleavage system H protein